MTISDLIARLKKLQDAVGSSAFVKISKDTDKVSDNVFEFFYPVKNGNEVMLVPTAVWDRNKK